MLKYILPMIPNHKIYVEPFFGGGAVFWAKEIAEVEIVNDINGNVVNFYEVLKTDYNLLKKLIDSTPYSRTVYKKALVICEMPFMFDNIIRAWAFWVCVIQGFSNRIGSWKASTIRSKESKLNRNKKEQFTEDLSKRLDLTQIENIDAVKLIKSKDTEDTFFYIDPPYIGSDQGHYGGYTDEHFVELLETLSDIKGRFLLSSYPGDILNSFKSKFKWYSNDKDMSLSASQTKGRRKTEVLTCNYKMVS